jgi:hypothetical protein
MENRKRKMERCEFRGVELVLKWRSCTEKKAIWGPPPHCRLESIVMLILRELSLFLIAAVSIKKAYESAENRGLRETARQAEGMRGGK